MLTQRSEHSSPSHFLYLFCLVMIMLAYGLQPSLAWADLTARLDRTEIKQNESVRLSLELDQQLSGIPNFELLSKDFEWSRPSQSSSVQIINGRRSAKTTWTLELIPKRSGQLTIPSMNVQGHLSQPLTLTVQPGPQTLAEKAGTSLVFVSQTLSNETPYVQEPFKVSFKIHHAQDLLRGSLSDWSVSEARTERLDQQTQFRTQINGKSYQVTEVHYWVTPQKSGTLTLPELVFTGEIAANNRRNFSPFNAVLGHRITDTVPAKAITVKPKPVSYPARAPWLPAEAITLTESWKPQKAGASILQARIGEALTRTLNISIQGQWAELIPEIEFNTTNEIKIYADQPPPS